MDLGNKACSRWFLSGRRYGRGKTFTSVSDRDMNRGTALRSAEKLRLVCATEYCTDVRSVL